MKSIFLLLLSLSCLGLATKPSRRSDTRITDLPIEILNDNIGQHLETLEKKFLEVALHAKFRYAAKDQNEYNLYKKDFDELRQNQLFSDQLFLKYLAFYLGQLANPELVESAIQESSEELTRESNNPPKYNDIHQMTVLLERRLGEYVAKPGAIDTAVQDAWHRATFERAVTHAKDHAVQKKVFDLRFRNSQKDLTDIYAAGNQQEFLTKLLPEGDLTSSEAFDSAFNGAVLSVFEHPKGQNPSLDHPAHEVLTHLLKYRLPSAKQLQKALDNIPQDKGYDFEDEKLRSFAKQMNLILESSGTAVYRVCYGSKELEYSKFLGVAKPIDVDRNKYYCEKTKKSVVIYNESTDSGNDWMDPYNNEWMDSDSE